MALEYAAGRRCANLLLMRLPAAALALTLATSAAHADTIAGRDGDTIDIHGEAPCIAE